MAPRLPGHPPTLYLGQYRKILMSLLMIFLRLLKVSLRWNPPTIHRRAVWAQKQIPRGCQPCLVSVAFSANDSLHKRRRQPPTPLRQSVRLRQITFLAVEAEKNLMMNSWCPFCPNWLIFSLVWLLPDRKST